MADLAAGTEPRKPMRRNAAWALLANAAQAGSQAVVLFVLAHSTDAGMVGAYALALAVLTPVVLVSRMQLRSVLVTDVTHGHSLAEYLAVRVLGGMGCFAIAAVFAGAWGGGRAALWLLGLAALRGVEGLGDIVQGRWQRDDAWRPVAGAAVARAASSYGVLCALLIWGVALQWALLAAVVGSTVIFLGWERRGAGERLWSVAACRLAVGGKLLRRAAPLGVVATLVAILLQIPRYAVDWAAGAEALGYFAALAHPFAVGGLLVQSAGQASLTALTPACDRLPQGYGRALLQLLAMAAALGAAGIVVALYAGGPLLTILYGAEYGAYAHVFPAVAASAAVMYVGMALGFALTAMRVYWPQVWLLALACAACGGAALWLTPRAGLAGAAWAAAGGWSVVVVAAGTGLWIRLAAYRRMNPGAVLRSVATTLR